MHPFNSTLHYALECFEGCKAYKDADGKIRIFRGDSNMARLKRSGEALTMPVFFIF